MTTFTTLRKSGGARVVTIPASLLEELHIEVGTKFQIEVADGRIELIPAREFTLEELLAVAPNRESAMPDDVRIWEEAPLVGREKI